jgi:hypothetical protein
VLPLLGTTWRFLKNLKVDLPYDLPIVLLHSSREWNPHTYTVMPIFIASLFTICNIWNQTKLPSTDEWIKKIWYICMYICIHNGVKFSWGLEAWFKWQSTCLTSLKLWVQTQYLSPKKEQWLLEIEKGVVWRAEKEKEVGFGWGMLYSCMEISHWNSLKYIINVC